MSYEMSNDPMFSRSILRKIQVPERDVKSKAYERDNPLYKQNNRATKVEESQNARKTQDQCPFCKETHDLGCCQFFLRRSSKERKAWLKDKSMCYAERRDVFSEERMHSTSLHDPEFTCKIKMKKQQDENSKSGA